LFDALDKIEKAISEVETAMKPRMIMEQKPSSIGERTHFVLSEIKLVRSLLKLAIPGSGITRTHSTLLTSRKRNDRKVIEEALKHIQECDPSIPLTVSIMIAPGVGMGFYEWDRDTIFVPLVPTREPLESVVTGVANYRIMLDMLQNGSLLKKNFEEKFKGRDFRSDFIRLYKSWVLGIGRGFRGALEAEEYEFVKAWVGPPKDDLFGPRAIAHASPEKALNMIKMHRGRINRAEGTFDDHYNLAILYWKQGRPADSLREIALAVKINPINGRALFTLGYLCNAVGYADKAKKALEETLEIAPNTIWQIYALDMTQKI
jgi:hypothetical protein